jgi:hypothetical protein
MQEASYALIGNAVRYDMQVEPANYGSGVPNPRGAWGSDGYEVQGAPPPLTSR